MRRLACTIVFLLLAMFASARGAAADSPAAEEGWTYGEDGVRYASPDGEFDLNINNRVQVRYTLNNPDQGSTKGSFDIARYKLKLDGRVFGEWDYRLQANLAGGSEVSEALLEDAWFKFTRRRMTQLWLGQGKTFFGRQALSSTGEWQFMDASIASSRFSPGRDVGAALLGQNREKTYEYQVGVYNGNGINKDESDNFGHMIIGRLVVTPMGEYPLQETDMDRSNEAKLAVGVSALLQRRGTEDVEEERLTRGCLEAAFKKGGWNLTAEFFTESTDIVLGDPGDEQDADGWYLQGGYLFTNQLEVVARYSEILKDTPEDDETEATLGLNCYFRDHRYKLQTEYRVLEFENTTGDEEFIDRQQFRTQLQMSF